MAFILKEEIVEKLVQDVNEKNPAFQFDWKTYLYVMKQEGRTYSSLILVENTEYFALIGIRTFDVASISGLDIIAKSEIQGLKFKQGRIQNKLRIRMFNGNEYEVKFNHKAGKHMPLHATNVARYQYELPLQYADRVDMKDHNSSLLSKIGTAVGILALFVLAIVIYATTESVILTIIGVVVFIVAIEFLLQHSVKRQVLKKDKVFFEVIEKLEANATNVPYEETYQAFQNIDTKPETAPAQVAYYSRLVQMAHYLGKDDEARQHLSLIPRRSSSAAEEEYLGALNYLAAPVQTEKETDPVSAIEEMEQSE